MVWENHDEAEETLAKLITLCRLVLDDGGRVRPRLLYKILPQYKAFDATDLKDKIYGVFGVARLYVHHYMSRKIQPLSVLIYRGFLPINLHQSVKNSDSAS